MKLDEHPKAMAFIAVSLGIAGIGVILSIAFWSNAGIMGAGLALSVIGIGLTLISCINLAAKKGRMNSEKKSDDAAVTVAPRRIPPRGALTYKDGRPVDESDDDDGEGGLVYDTFSAQPSPQRLPGERGDGMSPQGAFSPAGDLNDASMTPGGAVYGPRSTSVGGIIPPAAFISVTPVADSAARSAALAGSRRLFPLSPFEQRSFPVPEPVLTGDARFGAGAAAASRPLPSTVSAGDPGRPLPGPNIVPAATVTTTTTTINGRGGLSHRESEYRQQAPRLGTAVQMESPPPPRKEMSTGYDPRAHGYTAAELQQEMARNRDATFEERIEREAADFVGDATPLRSDDDRLPDGYWSAQRSRSGRANTFRPEL